MTIASAVPAHVTAVLLASRVDHTFVDALQAIAAQLRPVDALVVADATPGGDLVSASDDGLGASWSQYAVVRVPAGTDIRAALRACAPGLEGTDALWVLTGQSVPAADALGHLMDTLGADPAAGIAGPKVLDADRPGRLRRFGIQVSRSGRLQLDPRPGDPDQQQFDDRRDALAVPVHGALIRRAAYDDLGGHLPGYGGLGADLDFGWRARLAGHRVLLAPRARVLVPAAALAEPSAADRRDARRVALARRPLLLTPFIALWIALSSLATAMGLLLLKRPAGAARAAGDSAALLDPWRPMAARWRTRSHRRVRSREIRDLFVTADQTRAHAADRLHDVLVPRRRRAAGTPSPSAPGPAAPLLASPAIWGALAVTVVLVSAARSLPAALGSAWSVGFQGAELRTTRSGSTGLWHAWWDGWAGAGLGSAEPATAALPALATLTWLLQLLPGDPAPNPVGATVAIMIIAALPLAFLSAYAAGRVVTSARWPRAAIAGIWALSPAASAALGSGRLGALAVLVLLPLVLATVVAMTRDQARPGSLVLAALLTAALAALVPGALVVGAALGTGLIVAGSALARRRGAGYLLVLAVAAIPVLLLVRADPLMVLSGPGLLSDAAAPAGWHLALGAPDRVPADGRALGAAGDYRLWLGSGALLLGVAGLARRTGHARLAAAAAVLALAGLVYAVLAPTLQVGTDGSGQAVHPWPGTGVLVMTAGLLGAALLGFDSSPQTTRAGAPKERAATIWRVTMTTIAAAAALALAAQLAYAGLGDRLTVAQDPRPAVAIDQAEGPAATRSLVLRPGGAHPTYALLGREPGPVARDLAIEAPPRTLDAMVSALLDPALSGPDSDPVGALARWAVGFVIVDPLVGDQVIRRLDASAGLTRIGDYLGQAVWRVETSGAEGRQVPARVRLSTGTAWGSTLAVTGDHSATRATLPGTGGTLVVAELPGWAQHARVSVDGQRLRAQTGPDGQVVYAVPTGARELRIIVTPHHRLLGWAYVAVLLLLAYLAIPLGAPPRTRRDADAPAREVE